MVKYNIMEKNLEKIFKTAVEKFKTPLYFYDLTNIHSKIIKIKENINQIDNKIFFAFKANSNLFILKYLKRFGLGADVVSVNEYKLARLAGFEPKNIVVNGNGKTADELEFYSKEKVGCINVDSEQEILKMSKIKANIALRINPDVDPKTHPHISTGLKQNKFGMDFKTVSKVIKNLPKNLNLVGLHFHIGSQITDVNPYVQAVSSLNSFIQNEKLNLKFLNVGGGWGIDYKNNGDKLDLKKYQKEVLPILKSLDLKIYFEFGRYIIAKSGYLLTSVVEIKKTPYKNFIVVDASMNDLIRPSLYGAYHNIEFLSTNGKIKADIVGRACESADVLGKDRIVKEPKINDIGVIKDVGAYGYCMSSNYNLSLRPSEVVYDGKDIFLIREREKFEDLLKDYKGLNDSFLKSLKTD